MAAQTGDELPASRSGIVGKITVQNILDLVPPGASTLVEIACKNTSGGTITVGTPVYQTGTVGATATIEVAPANALISAGNYPAIGLLKTTLVNNDIGFVVISGALTNIITSPIDGAVPTTGDTVYLKSGGGLTLTKPTGDVNAIQNLGLIGKVSTGTAGSITVSSIMRANDVPNLPEGRIWVGDGNTIVSDTVFVDEPNLRLGLGIVVPTEKLHVEGNARVTGAFIDSNNQSGTTGQVLSSTATGTDWTTLNTNDAWGDITGTLSNQTDLQSALNAKQATLVSGTNIKTVGGTTILGSGDIPLGVTSIVAGTDITISPVGGTGAVTINSSGGTTISPNVANQVLTATGGSAIDSEPNFTFDGSTVIGGSSATITTSVVNQGVSGIYDVLDGWDTAYVSGEIMKAQPNGEAVTIGECLVLTGGFTWMRADATDVNASSGMLGIALQTSAINNGVDILIAGFVETTKVENTTATTGTPMYLRESTPGEMSDTIPGRDIVRLVGYCYQNSDEQANAVFILRFDPDNTWVELG